ncbi:MAG TPA: CehA/McbA family metallohydrolase [Actinomycetota bacterium]|nr:CehA/McbA family metallohydrolase [Actinomycetota bacterium]
MRRQAAGALVLALVAAALLARPAAGSDVVEPRNLPNCEWVAGDLHVHTWYSHDAWRGPGQDDHNTAEDEFYTWSWEVSDERDLAEQRGLDYISITDHNNIDAQSDAAWGTGDLVWLPNYENSLEGHAQMHGARKMYDNGSSTLADVERVASELRADGGAFQINHPDDKEWLEAYGFGFVPDAVEIWNIGVWAYEPPAPATNNHEFGPKFLDTYLDAGHHVTATGGSDSHWRSTSAAQGIGQPTTWLCVESRDWPGLVDAILDGRTTISHQPPTNGTVFADIRTPSGTLGSVVEPGTTAVATVQGAPGATLRLVTNGSTTLAEVPVTSPDFSHEFSLDEPGWVRAEVYYEDGRAIRQLLQPLCDAIETNITSQDPGSSDGFAYCDSRLAVVAMTSPVYFERPEADPTTSLVYDGATTARVGETAALGATLRGAEGPIAGAAIRFTYRDGTYLAVTDDQGRASVEVRVVGPPGTYPVGASFDGSDLYSPSSATADLTVTARP